MAGNKYERNVPGIDLQPLVITTTPQRGRHRRRHARQSGTVPRSGTMSNPLAPTVTGARDEPLMGSATSAPIPSFYQDFLPKREFMNRQDLIFIDGLFQRYGLRNSQTTDQPAQMTPEHSDVFAPNGHTTVQEQQLVPTKFGYDEYISAAKELREYADNVRERFSTDGHLRMERILAHAQSNNVHSVFEFNVSKNPVGHRIHDMVSIFHHHPKVRAQYIQIHAKKMELAYPDYVRALEQDREPYVDHVSYFRHAQRKLSVSMQNAITQFPPDHVDTIGYLMGYDEDGYYQSESNRRYIFATRGNGSFFVALRRIYEDAMITGKPLEQALRDEFLERDGVTFMLMRTMRHDFVTKGKELIKDHAMDYSRAVIQQAGFTPGSCPAILKMPSRVDEGTQRPIAYELAHATIAHMPDKMK